MIRGLGLFHVGWAAWAAAMIGTLLADPWELVVSVCAVAAPLAIVGVGLYQLDQRVRYVAAVLSVFTVGILDGFAPLVIAASAYALLPKASREAFSPTSREAHEVLPQGVGPWKAWLPYVLFVPLLALFAAAEYVPPEGRVALAQLGVTLGDLYALVGIIALLYLFSRGAGWTGQARIQLLIWAGVAFSAYSSGLAGVVQILALLTVALMFVSLRMKFPAVDPIAERSVDLTASSQWPAWKEAVLAHGFVPLAQFQSEFPAGTVSQDVYAHPEGVLATFFSTRAGGSAADGIGLQSWLEGGASVRSSNRLQWEDANDSVRHPIFQNIDMTSIADLLWFHRELVGARGTPVPVTSAEQYIALQRSAYADGFKSAAEQGLVKKRDGMFRFTLKSGLRLVWRTFDLIGALATQRRQ